MIALTKTFGLEHAPRVRANAVAPGPVDTAFLRGGTGRSNEDGASTIDVNVFAAMNPMHDRCARGHHRAGDVPARPRQRLLTGQTLWVNGGAYMP
jgi:3-oxoacyl-[acyl-carrier protein] reductase